MPFNFRQIIISGFQLSDLGPSGPVTVPIQIRFTRNSRQPYLARTRGQWNNTATYYPNDEVADASSVFWRVNPGVTPFSGGSSPTEGTNWTKSDKYDWADPDPSKVLFLQRIGAFAAGVTINNGGGIAAGYILPSTLSRYDAYDEAMLSPDRREVMLLDGMTVRGVDGNNAPVFFDFTTASVEATGTYYYQSFLNWLLHDPTALTTWNFNRVTGAYIGGIPPAYNDPNSYECYWMGDSKNSAAIGPDDANLAERSASAIQIGRRKITIEGGINRFEAYQTQDLFSIISTSDFQDGVGGSGPVQFVGGVIATNSGISTKDDPLLYVNTAAISPNFTVIQDWNSAAASGGGASSPIFGACVTSNVGLHYMMISTMFAKFALRTQMLWNPSLCSCPLNLWSDLTDQVTGIITSIRKDGGDVLLAAGICYEGIFGSDPRCNLNIAEITTPVSLGWNTNLADSLVKYALLFFSKLQFTIDQPTKQQRLIFKSLQYLNTPADYGVTSTTLASGIAQNATSCTVASGTNFLTAATSAIGKNAATYLAGGGTIYAQFQYQGIAQTIAVTAVSSNTVTFTLKDSSLAWPTGAALNPVQLIPANWRDGRQISKEPPSISAKHIEVSVKGDTDIVACPTFRNPAKTVEIAQNVRNFGPLGSITITLTNIIYNNNLDLKSQQQAWTPLVGGSGSPGQQFYGTGVATNVGGNVYNITCPNLDARGLLSTNIQNILGGSIGPGAADFLLLHLPGSSVSSASGQVTNVIDRNTIEFTTWTGSGTFPLSTTLEMLSGYDIAALQGLWLHDVTIGSALGVAADNVNTLFTNTDLTGTDIYGDLLTGKTIILPSRGVYKMVEILPNGGGSKIILDSSILFGGTNIEGRIGGPEISSDGWQFASNLFYMNEGGVSGSLTYNGADARFNAAVNGATDQFPEHNFTMFRNPYGGTDARRTVGAYTLSRLCVGLPEGATDVGNIPAPDDNHGAAHYSLAQAYCQKYIGVFNALTRSNVGVLANDGSLTGWSNGDSYIEQRDGAVRTYVIEGHDMQEFAPFGPTLKFRSREWPDFAAPLTAEKYPVLLKGANNSSGGAGSIGGGIGTAGGGNTPGVDPFSTLRPAALTASINNWVPGPFTEVTNVYVSSTAANTTVTGIAGGAEGDIVHLINNGTNSIALTNQDAGSIAANRFLMAGPGPNTLFPNATATLKYDGTAARWRVLAVGGGG